MEFNFDIKSKDGDAESCSKALANMGYVCSHVGSKVTVVTNEPGQLIADLYDCGYTVLMEDLKV